MCQYPCRTLGLVQPLYHRRNTVRYQTTSRRWFSRGLKESESVLGGRPFPWSASIILAVVRAVAYTSMSTRFYYQCDSGFDDT